MRQVLDQELYKTLAQRDSEARQARLKAGGGGDPHQPPPSRNSTFTSNPLALHNPRPEENNNNKNTVAVKRDFFGRVIAERPLLATGTADDSKKKRGNGGNGGAGEAVGMVWVTYHEGMNNAVRKPVSLEEFLRAF